jgi:hypothetical protein
MAKLISEDEWVVEQGTRGHGFTIASFPTKELAERFMAAVGGYRHDLHVIQGKEILDIRRGKIA